MGRKRLRFQHIALGLTAILLFVAVGPLRVWFANGDRLGDRSIKISDSRAGATAEYTLSISGQTAGTVGSIRVQFCSDSALIGYPCAAPSGFSISGATLTAQSGMGGFSIDTAHSTANVLVLTRTPGVTIPGESTYTLNGVVNPSDEGSFFGRVETFATTDASGADHDYGGIALAVASQINISTYVPPYMLFCVATVMPDLSCDTAAGSFIDFGDFSSNATSTGQTKLLVATNAESGYDIRVVGTTLTSGNNVIPELSGGDYSRIGTSQFGLNLVANTTPPSGDNPAGPGTGTVAAAYAVPDQYRFNSGEIVASGSTVEDMRKYTADYIVNIAKDQAPGVYVSTLTYISLASF